MDVSRSSLRGSPGTTTTSNAGDEEQKVQQVLHNAQGGTKSPIHVSTHLTSVHGQSCTTPAVQLTNHQPSVRASDDRFHLIESLNRIARVKTEEERPLGAANDTKPAADTPQSSQCQDAKLPVQHPPSSKALPSRDKMLSLLCCMSPDQISIDAALSEENESTRSLRTTKIPVYDDRAPIVDALHRISYTPDHTTRQTSSAVDTHPSPTNNKGTKELGSYASFHSGHAECTSSSLPTSEVALFDHLSQSLTSSGKASWYSTTDTTFRSSKLSARKKHTTRDFSFPIGAHPVQPRDLRRRINVSYKDKPPSWRQVLNESVSKPLPGTKANIVLRTDQEVDASIKDIPRSSDVSEAPPPDQPLTTINSEAVVQVKSFRTLNGSENMIVPQVLSRSGSQREYPTATSGETSAKTVELNCLGCDIHIPKDSESQPSIAQAENESQSHTAVVPDEVESLSPLQVNTMTKEVENVPPPPTTNILKKPSDHFMPLESSIRKFSAMSSDTRRMSSNAIAEYRAAAKFRYEQAKLREQMSEILAAVIAPEEINKEEEAVEEEALKCSLKDDNFDETEKIADDSILSEEVKTEGGIPSDDTSPLVSGETSSPTTLDNSSDSNYSTPQTSSDNSRTITTSSDEPSHDLDLDSIWQGSQALVPHINMPFKSKMEITHIPSISIEPDASELSSSGVIPPQALEIPNDEPQPRSQGAIRRSKKTSQAVAAVVVAVAAEVAAAIGAAVEDSELSDESPRSPSLVNLSCFTPPPSIPLIPTMRISTLKGQSWQEPVFRDSDDPAPEPTKDRPIGAQRSRHGGHGHSLRMCMSLGEDTPSRPTRIRAGTSSGTQSPASQAQRCRQAGAAKTVKSPVIPKRIPSRSIEDTITSPRIADPRSATSVKRFSAIRQSSNKLLDTTSPATPKRSLSRRSSARVVLSANTRSPQGSATTSCHRAPFLGRESGISVKKRMSVINRDSTTSPQPSIGSRGSIYHVECTPRSSEKVATPSKKSSAVQSGRGSKSSTSSQGDDTSKEKVAAASKKSSAVQSGRGSKSSTSSQGNDTGKEKVAAASKKSSAVQSGRGSKSSTSSQGDTTGQGKVAAPSRKSSAVRSGRGSISSAANQGDDSSQQQSGSRRSACRAITPEQRSITPEQRAFVPHAHAANAAHAEVLVFPKTGTSAVSVNAFEGAEMIVMTSSKSKAGVRRQIVDDEAIGSSSSSVPHDTESVISGRKRRRDDDVLVGASVHKSSTRVHVMVERSPLPNDERTERRRIARDTDAQEEDSPGHPARIASVRWRSSQGQVFAEDEDDFMHLSRTRSLPDESGGRGAQRRARSAEDTWNKVRITSRHAARAALERDFEDAVSMDGRPPWNPSTHASPQMLSRCPSAGFDLPYEDPRYPLRDDYKPMGARIPRQLSDSLRASRLELSRSCSALDMREPVKRTSTVGVTVSLRKHDCGAVEPEESGSSLGPMTKAFGVSEGAGGAVTMGRYKQEELPYAHDAAVGVDKHDASTVRMNDSLTRDTGIESMRVKATTSSQTLIPGKGTESSQTNVLRKDTDSSQTSVPRHETDSSQTQVPRKDTDSSQTPISQHDTDSSQTQVTRKDTDFSQTNVPRQDSDFSQTNVPRKDTDSSQTNVPRKDTDFSQTNVPRRDTDSSQTNVPSQTTSWSQSVKPHTVMSGMSTVNDKRDSHTSPLGIDRRDSCTSPLGIDRRDSHTSPLGADRRDSHTSPLGTDRRDSHTSPTGIDRRDSQNSPLISGTGTDRHGSQTSPLMSRTSTEIRFSQTSPLMSGTSTEVRYSQTIPLVSGADRRDSQTSPHESRNALPTNDEAVGIDRREFAVGNSQELSSEQCVTASQTNITYPQAGLILRPPSRESSGSVRSEAMSIDLSTSRSLEKARVQVEAVSPGILTDTRHTSAQPVPVREARSISGEHLSLSAPVTPMATRTRVRRPLPPEDKFPKYESKFHYLVRHKFIKPKRDHQTMGYAEVPVDPPNNFLKRNTNPQPRSKIIDKHPEYPTILGRPDFKPKRKPRSVYDEARGVDPAPRSHEPKDYQVANIQNAVRAVPRRPAAVLVDSRRGSTQLLETSGLAPKYVFRKDFGKTPEYLTRRLQEEEAERQEAERQRQNVKPLLRCITKEEREKLLQGLKTNWQELQTMFQGLPMMIDTVPKIKRKQNLEAELQQLEKDIACVERNPIIFVDEGAGDACPEGRGILGG